MTSEPGAPLRARQARRSRRAQAWRVGTPAVAVLSGLLFAVSAGTSQGTDLRPGRYPDLAGLVQAESDRYDALRARVRGLQDDVDRLGAQVDDVRVARTRREADDLRDPAGLVARAGPGVTVTLSDSPSEVFDTAVEAGADDDFLNRLVVHQQDIQAVVNAMWAAGADAVVIEGQRVVTTTGIKCEGNAVQLQGVPYPEPYTIQAVGDPDVLAATLEADELITRFRTDADDPTIDIGWRFEVESEVEAPAYDGLLDVTYAEPVR